ncbi:MAG: arylsulfatase [Phycisphaeraceae bacterium]
MRRFCLIFRLIACLALFVALPAMAHDQRPNVILIMTDDQGYGDIAAHGNPVIQTPNMDQLHSESIRLTDYHTDPTCSPTRAALLTGRYATRTGVWHTINGRSLLHPDEYTLAEYFKDNGYRTGMFGKWHLGANAPLRPMDQGFDHCVWSPGGAVNQGANRLGNDCFDDTYKVNDKWQKFPGYHTDVWYREAMKFIADTDTHGGEPFFVYLPTTAVHDPWNIEDEKAKVYLDKGVPPTMAKFYAMITNIDDNLGKLRKFLDDKGLAENTILIYTTDNGTTAGWIDRKSDFKYFGAGMRGWKGSHYDGGHRVPFFLHWPKGGLDQGRDVGLQLAHLDVMPTLGEMCGLDPIANDKLRGPIDGRSFRPWLYPSAPAFEPRTLFVHVQRKHTPPKWDKSVAMTERWRLVEGKELYDIQQDPGQENDIAADHPGVVKQLRADYETWWASLEPSLGQVVRFDLGGVQNPTTLMSHDWFMQPGEGDSAWHHAHVQRNEPRQGAFAVDIVEAGTYRVTPMRWPAYVDKPSGCVSARVEVRYAGAVKTTVHNTIELDPDTPASALTLDLPAGPAMLKATLTRADGEVFGAYYLRVERVAPDER